MIGLRTVRFRTLNVMKTNTFANKNLRFLKEMSKIDMAWELRLQ